MAGLLEMTIPWIEANLATNAVIIGSAQACLIVMVSWMLCRLFAKLASLQHLIWRAAVVALLIIGPLHCTTSGWRYAVRLPSRSATPLERLEQTPQTEADTAVVRAPSLVESQTEESSNPENDAATDQIGYAKTTATSSIAFDTASITESFSPAGKKASKVMLVDWIRVAWMVYFTIATWLAMRLVIGTIRLRRIADRASSLGVVSANLVQRAARTIGLQRVPSVRRSACISMPLVCGLRKSCVLVPFDFDEWPIANRETVLLHEFSHIARGDLAWEFLSRIVVIVYWFHPATYVLAKQLRYSCELATDEYVVRRGHHADEYAQGLLAATVHLANRVEEKIFGGVLAMAGSTSIEERLKNILTLRKLPLWLKSFCYAMSCLVVLLGVASTIRIERASGQSVENASVGQGAQSDHQDVSERSQVVSDMQSAKSVVHLGDRIRQCKAVPMPEHVDNALLTIRGRVVGSDGVVASNAVVVFRRRTDSTSTRGNSKLLSEEERWLFRDEDVLGKTVTDAKGAFAFNSVAAPNLPSNWRSDWTWDVVAAGENGDIGWIEILHPRNGNVIEESKEIKLRPTTSIAGRFIAPDGVPIANAWVRLTTFDQDFYDPSLPEWYSRRNPDKIGFWYSQIGSIAKTDGNGNFQFDGVPKGPAATVVIKHPDWCSQGAAIATKPNSRLGDRGIRISALRTTNNLVSSPATIVGDPGSMFRGRVVDFEGKTIAYATASNPNAVFAEPTNQAGEFSFRYSASELEQAREVDGEKVIQMVVGGPSNSHFLKKLEVASVDDIKSGKSFEFTLERGVKISGRVVTDMGEPIPGVRMEIAGPRNALSVHAITDVNGLYSVAAPKQEDAFIFATYESSGFQLPSRRSIDRTSRDELVKGPHMKVTLAAFDEVQCEDFVVKRSVPVRIRVLVAEGIPAKGASVTLKFERPYPDFGQARPTSMPMIGEISDTFKTDEKGEVTIRPKEGVFQSAYAEVLYQVGIKDYLSKVPIEASEDGVTEVRLNQTWHITGRVLKDGMPYPGVVLAISSHHKSPSTDPRLIGMSTSKSVQTATSDSEGRYEFSVPPGGEYRVGLERRPGDSGGTTLSYSLDKVAEYEFTVKDIQFLEADGEIAGKIVDSTGAPLSGARVSLLPSAGTSPSLWIGHNKESIFNSDAAGNFMLKKLPEGSYQLIAFGPRRPGDRTASVRVSAKTGDRDLKIVVDAAPLPPLPRLTPKSITELPDSPKN
jgi:beta-lactamase regulating signal transducer with metallopeptidase domain